MGILKLRKVKRIYKYLWDVTEGRRLLLLAKAVYAVVAWPMIWFTAILVEEMYGTKRSITDYLFTIEAAFFLMLTQVLWLEVLLKSLGII